MADVNVKLKLIGLNKVMRSAAVQSRVNAVAYRMKDAAGPGHKVTVKPHRWGARAFVEQEDAAQARKDPDAIRLLGALSEVSE